MKDERKLEDFMGNSVRSGEERSSMPSALAFNDFGTEDNSLKGVLPRTPQKRDTWKFLVCQAREVSHGRIWRKKSCKEREKLYFTYALNVNYAEDNLMSNGAYRLFLQDVFGQDQDTQREFRKFLGLCLSDIRNLKISVFLYGPSNSGKTVMLNLLKGMMGEELCASLSIAQMSSEFAITQLLGKSEP